MNLKALRLFRLVVVKGSLAEAAATLNLSPSAASRLLTLLESETKLMLFSRRRRRLVLTSEGEMFFRESEHILQGIDEIPKISEEIRRRTRAKLRLVSAVPLATTMISPVVSAMRREGLDFDCTINIESRFEIENKVGARRYNLGLISLPVANAIVALQVEPLLKARVEALLPRDHPLADQPAIRDSMLRDAGFVSLHPNQLWRQRLDEMFRAIGANPRISIETSSTMMVQQMVRDGAGVAIIDRTCIRPSADDTAVLRPILPERWVTYASIFPPHGRLPLANTFVDRLRAYVESLRAADADAAGSLMLLDPDAAPADAGLLVS